MNADLPLLALERLMKAKGCERVSEDAKDELKKILEQYLYEISQKASKISAHAGRKTIVAGDLLLARE
jgi:histone H3/H4